MRPSEAELRALQDIMSSLAREQAFLARGRSFVESRYPVAAARCAVKGWLDRQEQSEACKPNRRRYFAIYRLTAAGMRIVNPEIQNESD